MLVVRTLRGDVPTEEIGFTLAHEHVYCDFSAVTGDSDLAFTDEAAIGSELATARAQGAETLVEVSTYDMGATPERVAALCQAAGLQAVKSTGWFRSPFLDPLVAGRPADALAARLIEDIRDGFNGTGLRAGVIGEVGMAESRPTAAEQSALEAAAVAATETGVGIVAHSDDWANAVALVGELSRRGVRHERIMLAHARCADPISGQQEFVQAGVTLAFDQLGHPERDGAGAVAERIEELIARGCGASLAISADVGRRSRLLAAGGSGYMETVRRLLDLLAERGVPEAVRDALHGGAAARFLAFSDRRGSG
jgi:phosphotriesterase-related protein